MFSTQLRKYRLAAGLSQKELAGKLFVSQQAVARWETDKATPNPETVVKLAKIFGVTTDELLGKELVLGRHHPGGDPGGPGRHVGRCGTICRLCRPEAPGGERET